MQAGPSATWVQVTVACGQIPANSQTASNWVIEKFDENARRADLYVQLTHDGAGGECSDLSDLRPAVMAARGLAMRRWRMPAAIMRVLKDGLISIFAGCPVTGRRSWQSRAFGPAAGGWAVVV